MGKKLLSYAGTAVFILLCLLTLSFSKEAFTALQVTENDINIRSDSTVSSEVICRVNRGQKLKIRTERYGWYKVHLPKQAPCYIKRELVECVKHEEGIQKQCQAAKVIKSRINVRLRPDESSPILGKLNEGELVDIRSPHKDWYKISPPESTFGWIHEKFVKGIFEKEAPVEEKLLPAGVKPAAETERGITITGIINPHGVVFRRTATHKLITQDKEIFLLKGDKKALDKLNHRRAKATGKLITIEGQKYPLLEVYEVEVLD
ncbi:MAG: SH3 domain-containing protein [Candidatus Omnitrophota bacterium]